MTTGRQRSGSRARLRIAGEALVGLGLAGFLVAFTADFPAALSIACATASGLMGGAVLLKSYSNAPDGALMAMRDRAADAEARLADLEDVKEEIEERSRVAGLVIREMAADLSPDAIEPSEIERALRYLANPEARLKRPFGTWPRDAAEIAAQGGAEP